MKRSKAIGRAVERLDTPTLPLGFNTRLMAHVNECLPLYYSGETDAEDAPVEEQYAICVTKGNDELLAAINEVLADLMKEDENGQTQIEKMVMEHMNLD